MTWLLDHNLPRQIFEFLKSQGVQSETTDYRKWDRLKNGELVETAYAAGFRVLLTRDRLFRESAAKSLKRFPDMAIVLIAIPQARGKLFQASFKTEWEKSPIQPLVGQLLIWPHDGGGNEDTIA